MSNDSSQHAYLSEIFSSVQGEGLNIGRRQLFVRFCGCHRHCRYCDTNVARTASVAVEVAPGSARSVEIRNPISVEQLVDILAEKNRAADAHDDLFLTGGEPLLQAGFLAVLLPALRRHVPLPVHLETSGDLPDALAGVIGGVDHVLMDIKLPSVTGEATNWGDHRDFLEVINTGPASVTIKLVVGAETADVDLEAAINIIRALTGSAAVVLQPMTAAHKTNRGPAARQVLAWQSRMALALGRSVRVIPQCHQLMGLR